MTMTTRNNYNTNANGPDIESYAYHDTGIAQMDFKENMKILRHGGYRTSHVLFFTGMEFTKDSLSDFKVKAKKADLARYFESVYGNESYSDYMKLWKKQELIDYIIDDRPSDIKDLEDYFLSLAEYNIKMTWTNEIESYGLNGYSQGDYAEVFVDWTQIKKSGWKITESELIKYMENLCFDCPISACVTIDGQEYNYYDLPGLESEYDWNREEFIDWIEKESGVSRTEFENMLPEYPDYG